MTDEYKNSLPDEVDDRPDSDKPSALRTYTEAERTLTHLEAEVAGIVPGEAVYGDSSEEPNEDDQRDAHGG